MQDPAPTHTTARALILIGTVVRIAYGAGALLAPQQMVATQLAPDTHDQPEPRLLLRAFGGHQLLVAGFTLHALRTKLPLAPAAALSLSIDALDVAAALIEIRTRGHADRTLLGGIALSGTGVATFALALRTLPTIRAAVRE